MKIFLSLLVALAWCSQTLAQQEDKAPTLNPAEIYTCNYLKGKDRGDLDKVIERWNAWTDENDSAPYTAWLLTPIFFGPEITFDVAWLGAWPTNKDMGKSLQSWQDDGAEMNTAFEKVFACDQHSSFAVMPMQPQAEASSGVVRFMDCETAEGKSSQESVRAHGEFHKYMKSKGSETNAWIFFPGLGAGVIDFDYKVVLANPDLPSSAMDAEILTNGGGWMQAAETFDGTTTCDSARMYSADLIRNGASR
jgi:hypothetical protein